MATLYSLVREIEDFELQIDEETGEILNFEELEALELERDTKIENICLWIKNLRSDAEAYKKEEESFKKKRQAAEKLAERLTSRIEYMLGGSKFKTNRVVVSYRSSKSVKVDSVDHIPAEYLRIKQTVEPDKAASKKAIESGTEIKGCSLVERQNMSIK